MKILIILIFSILSYLSSAITCPSNCKTCSSRTTCSRCNSAYYLQNNLCKSCSSLFPNCLTCSSSYCSQCKSGYNLQSGKCIKCSPNCAICSNSLTCITCNSNYYKAGSQCSPCSKYDKYCSTCNNLQCLSCGYGYYLNETNGCSTCSKTFGSLCTYCNPNFCLGCTYGHEILANYACNENCSIGYYQIGNTCNSCGKMEYCAECSENMCFKCQSGYNLTNNQTCVGIDNIEESDNNDYIIGLISISVGLPFIIAIGVLSIVIMRRKKKIKENEKKIVPPNPVNPEQIHIEMIANLNEIPKSDDERKTMDDASHSFIDEKKIEKCDEIKT